MVTGTPGDVESESLEAVGESGLGSPLFGLPSPSQSLVGSGVPL